MGQDQMLYRSLLHFNPPGYCKLPCDSQVCMWPACRCTHWSINLQNYMLRGGLQAQIQCVQKLSQYCCFNILSCPLRTEKSRQCFCWLCFVLHLLRFLRYSKNDNRSYHIFSQFAFFPPISNITAVFLPHSCCLWWIMSQRGVMA